MTANFGCRDRRTMASQPSVYNEERNLLRLRAWEQRNQDSNQAKELNPENVPLFGQPYKTNKGDELSNRIQRMLGSYEDVNYSCPLTIEPLPIPSFVTVSQSDQGQPSTDKLADASFHNHIHYIDQKNPSRSSFSSQPTMMSAASSPNQHGHSSTLSNISLNLSEGRQSGNPAHQQKKNEALSDVSERVSLTQETSTQSPDDKLQPFLHSSYHNDNNLDTKDTFDRLQESTDPLSESTSTMDVSKVNIKPSPKDVPVTQNTKASTLPSQTFPPLLPSKQPSVVMTQKPTAYVRPMDGQDQVVSDSPELKPSPEPYVPLPESISISNLGKKKILPQLLETRANEALCVEDILREMTHAWPPLLTAIHTPSIEEPSKSPFSAKEAEQVSSCPSQNPSQLNQQSSTFSFEAAHSSGVESASSSDSESSSRTDSDSEGTTGEPHGPPDSSSVKTEPDAPAASHGDWQLGNWIRSNQPNSSTESQGNTQVSENKRLVPNPNPKHSSVDSCRASKLQLPTRQKEPSDNTDKLQQCRESHQDNCYQQSSQKLPSPNIRKVSRKTQASKPAKEGCTDPSEADFSVKCEETIITRNKDLCFTKRPKVKTETKHCKKSKDSDTKKGSKRASKHTVLDKRKVKVEPDDKLGLAGHCPSCGVQYPNPCSCPTKSPAQPVHLSSDQPVKISCSKPKAETTCQGTSKKPHKTTHKCSEIKKVKDPQVLLKAPQSLLVKIDLSLLSRVPQTSGTRRETSSNTKRSALVIEPDETAGSGAAVTHKPGKKSKASNVEVDKKTPRKKRRLENKNTSSAHVLIKLESSRNPEKEQEIKKAKKNSASLPVKETAKESKLNKRCSSETQDSSKKKVKSKDTCKHKQKSVKQTEPPHSEKKPPKSCLAIPSSSQSNKDVLINRPMLRFEDRQYPVKHYIKEAKRLKHRADAECDKLSKAFNYLDAAMFFVESGIAMEKDPQISMSSYTMFAETVDLLKFVLKLRNSVDPPTTPPEKDFIALCLKCQSLLQMAMFRHKHKTALKYSKTLTDHFSTSSQAPHDASVSTVKAAVTPSLMSDAPSPANTTSSSGPGSNHSGSGLLVGPVSSTVVVPQAIEQVAFSYVNITMLFLSAHDMWEQAEALVHKGSGMLSALDTVLGPLSLASTMDAMVHYTRQGVHWLRLDSQKVK